jgi:hypothetical protein
MVSVKLLRGQESKYSLVRNQTGSTRKCKVDDLEPSLSFMRSRKLLKSSQNELLSFLSLQRKVD